MEEVWEDIIMEIKGIVYDYTGLYQVSNFGRIKSLKRRSKFHNLEERIKSLNPNRNGYLQVSLCKDGKKKPYMVHRLVAKHFLEDFDKNLDVNHKDCNKQNNLVTNLEMTTRKENIKHAWENGLCETVRQASKKNIYKAIERRYSNEYNK